MLIHSIRWQIHQRQGWAMGFTMYVALPIIHLLVEYSLVHIYQNCLKAS